MKTDNIFFALIAALLLTASCASEDATQTGEQKQEQKTGNYTVFVSGKEDTSTEQPKTRTSLNYDTGAFYWETGDNIFVKDDGGTWQTGSNVVNGTQQARYRFQVPGAFANTSYAVYYPGKNGTNDQVTISTEQTQTAPADTKHFGDAGDCGLGTATAVSDGFFFKLDHKAAYLIFQPYNTNAELEDCYITQIEVTSNGTNIAGTYTISSTGLTEVSGSNKIKLTTKGTGSYANGFPLNNTAVKFSTNAAYMVIAPGTHALTVTYTVKDYATEVEGTITRQLPAFNYDGNTYYDMTCNFNITNYPSQQYYMWDAVNHFWYGYESQQPKKQGFGSGTDFPKSAADPQNRWYNPATFPTAASRSCSNCPNANELCWYVKKGDPHWDKSTLWTMGGHLFNQGVWIKKQSIIASDNSTTIPAMRSAAPDGINYTTSSDSRVAQYENYSVSQTKPTNINNYFYLPALGDCRQQTNWGLGSISGVRYWSSTLYGPQEQYSCLFYASHNKICVGVDDRYVGFTLFDSNNEDKYRPIGM